LLFLKTQTLNHTELHFYLLFYAGRKLGLSPSGENLYGEEYYLCLRRDAVYSGRS
jgi:hypothetical protein